MNPKSKCILIKLKSTCSQFEILLTQPEPKKHYVTSTHKG